MVDKIIEKSIQTIKIPIWVGGVITALLIPLLSFLMTFSAEHGTLMAHDKENKAEIMDIEKSKVDKSMLNSIEIQLNRMENTQNRIEQKVDNHIDKGK
jgi:stringent starvation protein B